MSMNEDEESLVDLLTEEERIADMQEIIRMIERDIHQENQRHMETLDVLNAKKEMAQEILRGLKND